MGAGGYQAHFLADQVARFGRARLIDYVAEIEAQEVTLVAEASLERSRELLNRESVYPYDSDEKAALTIGAVASKYVGIRFAELVISLEASRLLGGSSRDAVFLVQAYNTSRSFTVVEKFS